MKLRYLVKAFLAGIFTLALLSVPPSGPTPSTHAEMSHGEGTASQSCLAGCMNNGHGLQIAISNQRSEEEQDKNPAVKDEPHYTQFFKFQVPPKLMPQYAYGPSVLRPPDLVILYADYRS